ncbi:MAG: Conjugative transfer protein TrbL [Bryobacterales bacterium]|nr:Conjugative transfer protein TrbL [Bryobacterales bacterium]
MRLLKQSDKKLAGIIKPFRLIALLLFAVPVFAQAPNDVSTIIKQFQDATLPWLTVGEQVATGLFGTLAAIEFGVTLGMLALQQADITLWSATLVRKFLTVGAFYALLLLGPSLMQSVIDSYVQFGARASGVPSITAGDIAADGIDIASSLLISAVEAGATLSFVSALVMVCCALVIAWSFVKLVKGFVMAKIEAFITIYVAVIQLGWGGARFTSVYAERYVAAAMATGVKLMVFYFLIGVERKLAPSWAETAGSAALTFGGIVPTLTLATGIVLFCTLADPEKLAANIFSGQPQFTGHDVTNTYMPYINAGTNVALSGAGMAAGVATGGAAPFAVAGGRAASAVTSSAYGTRPQSAPPKILKNS